MVLLEEVEEAIEAAIKGEEDNNSIIIKNLSTSNSMIRDHPRVLPRLRNLPRQMRLKL